MSSTAIPLNQATGDWTDYLKYAGGMALGVAEDIPNAFTGGMLGPSDQTMLESGVPPEYVNSRGRKYLQMAEAVPLIVNPANLVTAVPNMVRGTVNATGRLVKGFDSLAPGAATTEMGSVGIPGTIASAKDLVMGAGARIAGSLPLLSLFGQNMATESPLEASANRAYEKSKLTAVNNAASAIPSTVPVETVATAGVSAAPVVDKSIIYKEIPTLTTGANGELVQGTQRIVDKEAMAKRAAVSTLPADQQAVEKQMSFMNHLKQTIVKQMGFNPFADPDAQAQARTVALYSKYGKNRPEFYGDMNATYREILTELKGKQAEALGLMKYSQEKFTAENAPIKVGKGEMVIDKRTGKTYHNEVPVAISEGGYAVMPNGQVVGAGATGAPGGKIKTITEPELKIATQAMGAAALKSIYGLFPNGKPPASVIGKINDINQMAMQITDPGQSLNYQMREYRTLVDTVDKTGKTGQFIGDLPFRIPEIVESQRKVTTRTSRGGQVTSAAPQTTMPPNVPKTAVLAMDQKTKKQVYWDAQTKQAFTYPEGTPVPR